MTGATNNKLRTADSLVFLILLKKTTTSEVTLKTGSRASSLTSASTVLELIPFLRSQKTSGASLERLLECSKWESASMVTQLMSVLIKIMSLGFLTTQCTIPSRTCSEERSRCNRSLEDGSKSKVISRTLMLLVSSLTTTTTPDS